MALTFYNIFRSSYLPLFHPLERQPHADRLAHEGDLDSAVPILFRDLADEAFVVFEGAFGDLDLAPEADRLGAADEPAVAYDPSGVVEIPAVELGGAVRIAQDA